MIRWCSYCQSYQGEEEPFDDFSMTHLICERCEACEVIVDDRLLSQQHVIAAYYSELRTLVRQRRITDASELLSRAPKLGIRCTDLVAGLIQPLVHWLGELWLSAELQPEPAEQFGREIDRLLDQLVSWYPELQGYLDVNEPNVLLFCAPESLARVGIRVVALGLASRAVSSAIVSPGNALEDVMEQLDQHRPPIVGFSVASKLQLHQLERFVAELRQNPRFINTTLLVGGIPIRMGHPLDPRLNLVACRDAMEILRYIDRRPSGPFELGANQLAALSARTAGVPKTIMDR